ncbi:hypothetical protein HanHA300_Chr09g0325091 [Helianthus annuus]|nr:hypothetical protein HanHA300_Chr09g0325091 [Helianthus annuus]KAJ0708053.1 hypothetical protein HanLR1_Chr09g0325311 [Helianthus annuus]KAJ0893803.1 hypothetical protein HanPSC8_Chr09g0381911 [Helianthus annuus]
MNLHQPANFHFFANGCICIGDLGYRALSTVVGGGVTFGHWVNQMYMKGYVLMVYSDYLKKMVE